ncbi:MAG: hypothetical protein J6K53_00665 [Roseburia sp.]|nr:hypothetical protein [Roseburia sp.]
MLDRLIECENRLLREQKNVNDLLAEFGSGNGGDELTRIKIEEIQKEIDLLGRQLAVMRDAVQMTQGNAAQMQPPQTGQPQQFQTPPQPQPTMQQPQMGVAQPGQMPQQQMGTPQPQMGTSQPQMGTPQPTLSQPQENPLPQQPRQMTPQPQQHQGHPQPQMGAQQPGQMQLGQQFQTSSQMPQQALYRQNAPQKDFEKTFGEAILPICASVLIFISFIFFAAIVLPYLNNTVKMVLMYVASAAIALTGGVFLLRDSKNKGFVALTGCGMGALYLSLMLSNIYFRAMGEAALYIGLLLWTVAVCVMSKLRSNSFLIIGQIGVNLSVLLGVYLCTETEDAAKLLFLTVYTLAAQAVFYISHLQREYNRNIANHIGWCVGLLLLACGVNEPYLKGTLSGGAAAALLLLALGALIVLSIVFFRTDEKKSVAFGILNILYVWAMYALVAYHFAPAEFSMAVIAALVLVALELRMPGERHAGKTIFQCALFFQIFLAWTGVDFLKEYVSVSLLAAVCLFYGFYRKNVMYKIAGFVYLILLAIVSMNGFAQLFWCLALAVGGAILLRAFRNQYRTWMKVTGYLVFAVTLLEALCRMLSDSLWDTWGQNLLIVSVMAAVNIVMAKVPALRRNLSSGEEEQGVRIATGVVQILFMLYCCTCIFLVEGPGYRLWAVLLGAVLVCTNSVSLVIKEKSEVLSVYAGIKLLVFVMVVLGAYHTPGFLISLAGLVFAAACIIFGFATGRLLGKDLKGIRIYGLAVVMLCIVKLLLFDIHFDNLLFRAAGLFVSGVLCFGISIIYHLVDKRLMGNNDRNSGGREEIR